jgi:hypothetical protein
MRNHDQLIDQLADDLTPSKGVSLMEGRLLLAATAMASAVVLVALFGMRPDFVAGVPHPVPLLCLLLTSIVAIAAAVNVTAMARPAVGAIRAGWAWALAALVALPLGALVTAPNGLPELRAIVFAATGSSCFFIGTAAAISSVAALAMWLKRGAPTSAARASWLIGAAGGCVGASAVALTCPNDSIIHIGIWHAAIIPVSAVASRLIVAPLLRW